MKNRAQVAERQFEKEMTTKLDNNAHVYMEVCLPLPDFEPADFKTAVFSRLVRPLCDRCVGVLERLLRALPPPAPRLLARSDSGEPFEDFFLKPASKHQALTKYCFADIGLLNY